MALTINNNRISFPNSRLRFRNFKGKNKLGYDEARNFCVDIQDEDMVQDLIDYGFNVKYTTPMDLPTYEKYAEAKGWEEPFDQYISNFVPTPYIQIKVTNKPGLPIKPNIRIYEVDDSTGNAIRLDQNDPKQVEEMDEMYYKHADVVASVYEWAYQGNNGVSLYLYGLYFHTEPYSGGGDEFYQKYVLGQDTADEPELPFD